MDTPWGFPCCVRFPCVHAAATTPAQRLKRIASLISSRRISLPRKGCRVALRIVLFEDYSAFTRVAACTLALSPIRDTLIEGFSHFVTSMTAPIASGWSGCRVGLVPTGKRRLARRTPIPDLKPSRAQYLDDVHCVALRLRVSGKRRYNAAPTSDCHGGSAPVRPHVNAAQIDANDSARRSSSAFVCANDPLPIRPMACNANSSAA